MYKTLVGNVVYAISADRRLLVMSDINSFKIKTYVRSNDGIYRQEVNQNGELLTPEYSFEDLGFIPAEQSEQYENSSDIYVHYISFSRMNSNENESGYQTRIAFVVRDNIQTKGTIYIFRISTYDGTMELENEKFIAGQEGATASFVKYNKWIITNASSSNNVIWSPYSYKFAHKNTIYELKDTTMGTEEDYSNSYEILQTYGNDTTNFKNDNIRFLNNDRVVCYTFTDPSSTYYRHIDVYDEHFTLLKHNTSGLILSPDCLYGILDGTKDMCAVSINYTTGDISFQIIAEDLNIDISALYARKAYITSSNNYLVVGDDGRDVVSIYKLDFQNGTCELFKEIPVEESFTEYDFVKLPDNNSFTFCFTSSSTTKIYLIEPMINEKNLVGIRYNGENYYSSLYKTGLLTAKQEDVVAGKTFIGYNGTPETGTMGMEVVE